MNKPNKPVIIDDIAQMIDISAVRINSTDDAIVKMVDAAHKYHCYLVTVLPAQTMFTKQILSEFTNPPKLGGNVGFPSGSDTTTTKILAAKELLSMGVDEIDMVINVAGLLSGRVDDVYNDIYHVVETAANIPVKVILECYYLTNDQIRTGCDLAIKAGADFVKTGTGWAPTGATLENLSLIKAHVGQAIKIKASGGIRDVNTLLQMYKMGVNRFGISTPSAVKIIQELNLLTQPIFLT
jgi:deoxyribose-phosphate aldolase